MYPMYPDAEIRQRDINNLMDYLNGSHSGI
jgi:hypothetical protein